MLGTVLIRFLSVRACRLASLSPLVPLKDSIDYADYYKPDGCDYSRTQHGPWQRLNEVMIIRQAAEPTAYGDESSKPTEDKLIHLTCAPPPAYFCFSTGSWQHLESP